MQADGGIEDLCGHGLLDGSTGPEDFLDGFLPGLFTPEHEGDIDWCLDEERQSSIPTPDTPDHLSFDRVSIGLLSLLSRVGRGPAGGGGGGGRVRCISH